LKQIHIRLSNHAGYLYLTNEDKLSSVDINYCDTISGKSGRTQQRTPPFFDNIFSIDDDALT